MDLRVGGKCGVTYGDPVDLRVTVQAIVKNHTQGALEARTEMGDAVWVEADNDVHLLLVSVRGQVFGADAFTGTGITLDDKKLVVVKSTQHFHAGFRADRKEGDLRVVVWRFNIEFREHPVQGVRPRLLAAGGRSLSRLLSPWRERHDIDPIL